MSLSTQYSTGTYTRQTSEIKTQSIVEIKFSGDIGEVIALYPQIYPSTCEASSGRVNYSGKIVCTLVYADENGNLCRIQKGAEFTHYADNDTLAPAQVPLCTLSCERTQLKREGSQYVAYVVVGARICVFASTERRVLTSAEGGIVNTQTVKLCSAVTFTGESEVEDEFDCNAEDILIPSAEVGVTDCNCQSGRVEITGELYLSMLATRGGKPVGLDRIIPYKAEIPLSDALLLRKGECRADVKDISLSASVNEDKGKCKVNLTAQLYFTGCYYEEEDTSAVLDMFSPQNELNLSHNTENYSPCVDIRTYTEKVTGLCATKAKIDYTCSFLASAMPKAEFTRSTSGVEGSVCATLIYSQNGEIHSTEINLPFSVNLSEKCKEVKISVCGVNLKQRSEGECEGECVLKISTFECENLQVSYISEANEGKALQHNDCAFSVYVPAAGDTLWDTAKKLLQSPEEIQSSNPDLSFPLCGKERILIYRPKQA